MEDKDQHWVLFPTLFFEIWSLPELEAIDSVRLAWHRFLGILQYLSPHNLDYSVHYHFQIFVWVLVDWHLGPHTCGARTFLTQLPPQSSMFSNVLNY